MPFTPFHFGPGLLGKGLAPRSYSWSAFVAINVVIIAGVLGAGLLLVRRTRDDRDEQR